MLIIMNNIVGYWHMWASWLTAYILKILWITLSFWAVRYAESRLILVLRPTNERRRYFVTTSVIGWVQAYKWSRSYWGCKWCILLCDVLVCVQWLAWFIPFLEPLRVELFHGPLLLTYVITYLEKMWDEITHPFPNFIGYTVEVWKRKDNFAPYLIMDVITYPYQT